MTRCCSAFAGALFMQHVLFLAPQTAVTFTVKNSGVRKFYVDFTASDFVVNVFTVTDKRGNVIRSIHGQPLGAGMKKNNKIQPQKLWSRVTISTGHFFQLCIKQYFLCILHELLFAFLLLHIVVKIKKCTLLMTQSFMLRVF